MSLSFNVHEPKTKTRTRAKERYPFLLCFITLHFFHTLKNAMSIHSFLEMKLFMEVSPTTHSMWGNWWACMACSFSRALFAEILTKMPMEKIISSIVAVPSPKRSRTSPCIRWDSKAKGVSWIQPDCIGFSIFLPDSFVNVNSPPGQCIQRCFLTDRMYGGLFSPSAYLQKTSGVWLEYYLRKSPSLSTHFNDIWC